MDDHPTVRAVIERAVGLITDRERFAEGFETAQSGEGKECGATSPNAVAWSASGALTMAFRELGYNHRSRIAALARKTYGEVKKVEGLSGKTHDEGPQHPAQRRGCLRVRDSTRSIRG